MYIESSIDEVSDKKNGRRSRNYNACLPAHLEGARLSISARTDNAYNAYNASSMIHP